MKFGHSILLGETIDAADIQYRDCERFQVVCPHCYEPIFKVRRAAGSPDEIHFYSHYVVSGAYQGECDLRVKSYSRSEIEARNQVSRDQRLSYFLSVLRRTLGMAPNYITTAENHTTAWKSLRRFCGCVMHHGKISGCRMPKKHSMPPLRTTFIA